MASSIVLIHGLWFRAQFMHMLARRLEDRGFDVHGFNYRTTRAPIEHSAAELFSFCRRQAPLGAHLVGYSLGGLLALHMLSDCPWNRPGRLLFLGTPLRGSATARRARSLPGGARLLGHAEARLSKGLESWPEDRETGMIAGTKALGIGVLAGGLQGSSDGTVAVSETVHPGLTDRVELPVTHSGMLFSKTVARQAGEFLHGGRFVGHG